MQGPCSQLGREGRGLSERRCRDGRDQRKPQCSRFEHVDPSFDATIITPAAYSNLKTLVAGRLGEANIAGCPKGS